VVSRESVFWVGGGLSIALGVALGLALWVAGAGYEYAGAWFAAFGASGFGVFCLYVARDLQRYRAAYVRAIEAGLPPPPGGPPL
jgi:hypothetical protein